MLQTCWNHNNLAQQQQPQKMSKNIEKKKNKKNYSGKITRKENQFSSQQ